MLLRIHSMCSIILSLVHTHHFKTWSTWCGWGCLPTLSLSLTFSLNLSSFVASLSLSYDDLLGLLGHLEMLGHCGKQPLKVNDYHIAQLPAKMDIKANEGQEKIRQEASLAPNNTLLVSHVSQHLSQESGQTLRVTSHPTWLRTT